MDFEEFMGMWESDAVYQTPSHPVPIVPARLCGGCERPDMGEYAEQFALGIELAARERRGYERALSEIAASSRYDKTYLRARIRNWRRGLAD